MAPESRCLQDYPQDIKEQGGSRQGFQKCLKSGQGLFSAGTIRHADVEMTIRKKRAILSEP